MSFEVITSNSSDGLNILIKKYIEEGYKPIGSHKVVGNRHQNRFRGSEHVDTIIQIEYSISMIKD